MGPVALELLFLKHAAAAAAAAAATGDSWGMGFKTGIFWAVWGFSAGGLVLVFRVLVS